MKKALLFEALGEGAVTCRLCAHGCQLKPGAVGICGVRKNINGELFSLNYDRVAATHSDPIEKKPLYHFLPASTSYSVAAMGCNFRCDFCQNNSLSMVDNEAGIYGESITPEALVNAALRYGSQSISYTYSEPTIYFELMLETAKLARQHGIRNVMVSNGFMSADALNMIAPYMDAANIDLKAFSDDFYRKYCGGRLEPVLETIRGMWERNIWVELTTLLIPDLNSDEGEIRELVSFILTVNENIPWHVSRFFPQHRLLDVPPTPPDLIYRVLEIGSQMGLNYLYAGNVADDRFTNTYCSNCRTMLIERSGYFTRVVKMEKGKCAACSHEIPGVW